MKKINDIDIRIERAIVNKISIELKDDGKAEWMITASLLTREGRKITEFSTGNYSWDEKNHIKIPVEANLHGRMLFELFMPLIIKQINGEFISLPAPKK